MKIYLTSLIGGLALFAAITGYTSAAYAYQTAACGQLAGKWPSNRIEVRAAVGSFPVGDPFTKALTATINMWNRNPSNFSFKLTLNDTGIGQNNNKNQIWFGNLSNNVPGTALTRWENCELKEVDVVINSNLPFSTTTNKRSLWGYGGANRPLQTLLTHELGHFLGLLHENRYYNAMGNDWTHMHTNGGVARAYVGEDTANGAVFLYGLDSLHQNDVSVVHWKYLGPNGEYTAHTRTQMYDTAGQPLNSFVDNNEPGYNVNSGQEVQIELTYENNGAENQNDVEVGYYISSNDSITTDDTLIVAQTFDFTRDNTDTRRGTVTIPESLAPGNYYIGAIVDRNDEIQEVNEANNATYLAAIQVSEQESATGRQ